MCGIGCLLPFRQVAAGIPAIRGRGLQIVIIVDVTRCAGHVGVSVRQQKTGKRVIKIRAIPAFGRVAVRAISHRKDVSGAGVHGIIRLLPGREVTTGVTAIGRRNSQVVVVVNVAGTARHIGVAIGQQKTSRAVIELSPSPGIKGMTGFAGDREVGGGMVRINRFLIFAQMA